MRLESIKLNNFKNYVETEVEFNSSLVCLVGENGSGKTNLLDAIYYMGLTKSAFSGSDLQKRKHGQEYFTIKGVWQINGREKVVFCSFKKGQKKIFQVDDNDYDRFSEHLGVFPVVLICPDDADLIRDFADRRRKFVDTIICQIDKHYIEALTAYNHLLKQRNAYLKSLRNANPDFGLISSFDDQLYPQAKTIHHSRRSFLKTLSPLLERFYQVIAKGKETVSISYKSDLESAKYFEEFKVNQHRDLIMGRTEMGIHRDDFKFKLDGYALKKYGSQGQQKSFIISLRMAEFEILKKNLKVTPILLLDDIFDKLDDSRLRHLVNFVPAAAFGQLFITDARKSRIESVLKRFSVKPAIYQVKKNKII